MSHCKPDCSHCVIAPKVIVASVTLRVVTALTDCDRDTLLVRVEVEGAGVVCHRGTRSCFTEAVAQEAVQTAAPKVER